MARLDPLLKLIWLLIGILLLTWLGLVRAPQEWRRWQSRRATPTQTQRARPEPAIIVGEQAARDRADRIRRQTLRFGRILDPALQISAAADSPRSLSNDDWLIIPVELHTLATPTPSPANVTGYDPATPYTWQSGLIDGTYHHVALRAVNLVFYRRDGTAERLLLDRPAWVQAVLLPTNPGEPYFYELSLADTNGDDRIDGDDSITLWSSGPDGSDLELVWMPRGKVAPTRYREPVSGDLFGTLATDTDADGEITADDRHRLFRIALGDTVARPVVSAGTVERIEAIVHGGGR